MFDALGDRIKNNYENRTRFMLPRRTYTVLRIDGKAFHSWTRGLIRPYDDRLIHCMIAGTDAVLNNLQGAILGFTQSDESSILLTDFAKNETEAAYDGNLQKICSIASSIFTAHFNQDVRSILKEKEDSLAFFDCRVFTIPDRSEVANYFLWRYRDCVRNSVSSLAQSMYSAKELHGKNITEQLQMIYDCSPERAWDKQKEVYKNGTLVLAKEEEKYLHQKWDYQSLVKLVPEYL